MQNLIWDYVLSFNSAVLGLQDFEYSKGFRLQFSNCSLTFAVACTMMAKFLQLVE